MILGRLEISRGYILRFRGPAPQHREDGLVSDEPRADRADEECGHRPSHAEQPRPPQLLRPRDAASSSARTWTTSPRRRHQGGPAPRRGRRVQHRRRHGQRLRLVRRRHHGCRAARTATAVGSPAEPAPPPVRRPPDLRLLPRLPGLPEGRPWPRSRLRARWRLRAGADGGHLGGRPRHEDRHAGHPLPRPGARHRSTCSSTGSDRSWPAGSCSPATPSRPASWSTCRSSPRSSTTTPWSRPAPTGGPGRWPGCRPTASSWPRRPSGSSSSCRATRARRCSSYLFHAYGTNLQFEDGRVQLRQDPSRARDASGPSSCATSTSTSPNPDGRTIAARPRSVPKRSSYWRATPSVVPGAHALGSYAVGYAMWTRPCAASGHLWHERVHIVG